jgi:hypothetical protein
MTTALQLVGLLSALCVAAAEDGDHDRVYAAFTKGFEPEETDILAQAVQRVLMRDHPDVAADLTHVLSPLCYRAKFVHDEWQRRDRECAAVAHLDAHRKMQWLRQQTLGYVAIAATAVFFGVECPDSEADATDAVLAIASHIGLDAAAGQRAATSIRAEARDIASRFHDALRRRIWPLCASRAPGEQIVAAAEAVHDRFGGWLVPSDALVEECRRVAAQTVRRRHHAVR